MKKATYAIGLLAGAVSISAHAGFTYSEGFDNVTALAGKGWVTKNNSSPAGSTSWFQGNNTASFSAESGAANSYIGANFNNSTAGGNVDNWLISPVLSGADTFSFSTISDGSFGIFNDKLEVRYSATGDTNDLNSFSTVLLTVGGNMDYAEQWANFSFDLAPSATARVAFRYVGAADSLNYIGIDSFSAVPEPETLALFALALGGAFAVRRRKTAMVGAAILGATLSTAALAHEGHKHAAPTATPAAELTADAMTVVIDAETGLLRAPTASEVIQMNAKSAKKNALRGATVGPQTFKYANGMQRVRMTDESMSYSMAVIKADGSLEEACIEGKDAAQATMKEMLTRAAAPIKATTGNATE